MSRTPIGRHCKQRHGTQDPLQSTAHGRALPLAEQPAIHYVYASSRKRQKYYDEMLTL